MDTNLRDALRQMEAVYDDAESEAARAEAVAADARRRADALRAAVENLRRFLGETAQGPTTVEAPVVEPEEEQPSRRRKVPTSTIILDFLKDSGRPMTRDTIVRHFKERGLSAAMKNPVGAIQTALTRNVAAGTIRLVGLDRYEFVQEGGDADDGSATKG